MTEITVRRVPSRTLSVLEPFYRPMDVIDELQRFAAEMWESPIIERTGLTADFDMYEENDELAVKMELPGIKKEEIEVNLEGDVLQIKAVKKHEEMKEGRHYLVTGRTFGEYFRSITLPYPVASEKVCATFEHGLLEIRLPKAEEAKVKKIDVKVK